MQTTYFMVRDMSILDDVTTRVGLAAVCAITLVTVILGVISFL